MNLKFNERQIETVNEYDRLMRSDNPTNEDLRVLVSKVAAILVDKVMATQSYAKFRAEKDGEG